MEDLSLPPSFSCPLPVPRGSVADQTPSCSLTSDISVKVVQLIVRMRRLMEAKRKHKRLVPSQYCNTVKVEVKNCLWLLPMATLKDMAKNLWSEGKDRELCKWR